MRIRRLRIENWRGVSSSEIVFGDGVTIVAGPNEAGKSSLFEALRFLFRFPDSSTHRDIEAVRPVHVDQAPTVELEADLGDVSIRYAKRFRKAGRTGETTLRVDAPGRNPENLTGREAHDRAEALLAADIDVDLWEALQVEQGTGIRQASLAQKRGLQEALDAAAGSDDAPTRDDAALVARIEAEFRRYFTATGRPRDALDTLPRQIAAAETQRAELLQKIAAMQSVADRHEQARRQLAAKEAALPAMQAQVVDCRRRLEQVQTIEAAYRRAELELKDAETRLGADQRAAAQRSEWRDELGDRSAGLDRDQARLATLGQQRTGLQSGLAELQQRQAQLREVLAGGDTRRRQCRLAIEDAGYQRELEAVGALLARVEDLDRRRLEAQAVVDGIGLAPADIEALRRLERSLVEAEATARAVAPALRLTALADLDIEVRGEPVRLAPGESRADTLTAGFSLRLPGVLELSASSTASIDQSQAAVDRARQALSAALAERLVTSLAQAEARLARKQAAEAQAAAIQSQRAEWLGRETEASLRAKASELAARRTAIEAELSETGLYGRAAEAQERLLELDARLQAVQSGLDETVEEERVLQARLSALDVEVATLTERAAGNLAAVQRLQAAVDAARAEIDDEALAARLAANRTGLLEAAARFELARDALQAADPASVGLLAENAEAALDRQQREIGQVRVDIGQLQGQLAQARHEGLFDQLSAAESGLEALRDEFRRVERRALAARRLWQVLDAHRVAASQRYVRPLKDRIEALGRLVFDPSFSVDIGTDLSIESRSLDGVTVPFDSLSGGAREQLGILARLAAAQIVGARSEVPVLMDDTLGFTDDARLTRMGAAIASVARDNQVVILTCMPSRFSYIGNAKTVTV